MPKRTTPSLEELSERVDNLIARLERILAALDKPPNQPKPAPRPNLQIVRDERRAA